MVISSCQHKYQLKCWWKICNYDNNQSNNLTTPWPRNLAADSFRDILTEREALWERKLGTKSYRKAWENELGQIWDIYLPLMDNLWPVCRNTGQEQRGTAVTADSGFGAHASRQFETPNSLQSASNWSIHPKSARNLPNWLFYYPKPTAALDNRGFVGFICNTQDSNVNTTRDLWLRIHFFII